MGSAVFLTKTFATIHCVKKFSSRVCCVCCYCCIWKWHGHGRDGTASRLEQEHPRKYVRPPKKAECGCEIAWQGGQKIRRTPTTLHLAVTFSSG
eukprot:5366965-Amphidinium_carterae.1